MNFRNTKKKSLTFQVLLAENTDRKLLPCILILINSSPAVYLTQHFSHSLPDASSWLSDRNCRSFCLSWFILFCSFFFFLHLNNSVRLLHHLTCQSSQASPHSDSFCPLPKSQFFCSSTPSFICPYILSSLSWWLLPPPSALWALSVPFHLQLSHLKYTASRNCHWLQHTWHKWGSILSKR